MKDVKGTQSSDVRHPLNLDWAKAIKVDGGVTNTEFPEDIGVPRKGQVGIHAALHEHATATRHTATETPNADHITLNPSTTTRSSLNG